MQVNPVLDTLSEPHSGARAILAAATELFAQAGFEAVSVAGIAHRAGVCKANVFHHFESKEALYVAVMQEACRGHAEFTESLLPMTLSSAEKLRRLVAFDFEDMIKDPLRARLVFREVINAGCEESRRIAEQVFRRNFEAVTAVIRQGIARGEFHAETDPAIAAWTLGAAVTLYFQNLALLQQLPGLETMDDPQRYADHVFKLLLGGVLMGGALPVQAAADRAARP